MPKMTGVLKYCLLSLPLESAVGLKMFSEYRIHALL